MGAPPFLMSLFTLALLLPALYRRHQRRTGAPAAGYHNRAGRNGKYGDGLTGVAGGVTGLFYGDAGQFAAQVTDAIVIVVFCSLMTIAFFRIVDRVIGLRSDEEAEISGLDMPELGAMAYPDFLEAQGIVFVSPHDHEGDEQPVTAKGLREELVR